jgi:hypothetical protein
MNKKDLVRIEKILLSVVFIATGGYIFGLSIFFAVISGLIGYLLGNWYSERKKINNSLVKFIAWSNILTWFVPVVGFATSCFIYKYENMSKAKNKKFYYLSIIGFILSLITIMLSAYLRTYLADISH